jgi:hypothetical protein
LITGNAAPGGIGAGILNHGTVTIAGSRITATPHPTTRPATRASAAASATCPPWAGCQAPAC